KIPEAIVIHVMNEAYWRGVAPWSETLSHYRPFSDEVYGELKPKFVSEILELTGLTKSSLFLDIGCGVGNVVCQASLQTGCTSHGMEIHTELVDLGQKYFLPAFKARCSMWGFEPRDIYLRAGDVLKDPSAHSLIRTADVVLVNNRAFKDKTNIALTELLGDLKNGAWLVTLKALGDGLHSQNSKGNKGQIMKTPWCLTEHAYPEGSVSWVDTSGHYYVARVNKPEARILSEGTSCT
ncbi:histone methylation DOT1, partial [Mycena maculata]